MCFWSDITAVQDYEMYYINTWLKRCVFNLDLNRESVSEPPNIIRKAIPEFGRQIWKNSTLFSGFCYLSTKSRDGYRLHFIDTILLIDTGAYRYCHWDITGSHHTGTSSTIATLMTHSSISLFNQMIQRQQHGPRAAWQTSRHGWKNITYSSTWQRLSFLSSLPLQLQHDFTIQ